MIQHIFTRLRQGYRTHAFPAVEPELPDRFLGLPEVHPGRCDGCRACVEACPTKAIGFDGGQSSGLRLDLGRCLFCGQCQDLCRPGAIVFTRDYRLAVRRREDLVLRGGVYPLAQALEPARLKLFSRSLKLRQVSAAGCGACELDTNVLGTLVFDLPRFGISFTASPRHADGLLVTGCVGENMRLGLEKTLAATPKPHVHIALGACALSGGPYAGHPEAHDGCAKVLDADLFIPGCPPHPWTILDGLLRLLGRRD